jgi:hypothetical protein
VMAGSLYMSAKLEGAGSLSVTALLGGILSY